MCFEIPSSYNLKRCQGKGNKGIGHSAKSDTVDDFLPGYDNVAAFEDYDPCFLISHSLDGSIMGCCCAFKTKYKISKHSWVPNTPRQALTKDSAKLAERNKTHALPPWRTSFFSTDVVLLRV